jgi:hypothetical protein
MSYPTKGRARVDPRLNRQAERLAGLAGEPNVGGQDVSAITRDALAALGNIAIKSVGVSAAPTAADFNDLRADVLALAAVLKSIGAKITGL